MTAAFIIIHSIRNGNIVFSRSKKWDGFRTDAFECKYFANKKMTIKSLTSSAMVSLM